MTPRLSSLWTRIQAPAGALLRLPARLWRQSRSGDARGDGAPAERADAGVAPEAAASASAPGRPSGATAFRRLRAALSPRPRAAAKDVPAAQATAAQPLTAGHSGPPGSASGRRRWATGLRLPRRLALPALPGGLRPWITCLSLGFVLAALVGHGRQLLQLSLDRQGWLWLALALGLQAVSLLVNGLAWGEILRWRGLQPRWDAVVTLYVGTNLRKYLPGGIWHLASRVQALRDPQAPLRQGATGTGSALVVTLLDPLLAAVAALALVPLGGWQNGLAVLCLLPLLLLHPRWLQPLLRRLERQRARQLGLSQELEREATGEASATACHSYPVLPLLAELAFVLLRFAGFACCVWAFDLQLSLDLAIWLAGFALAWTAGLVVPGAPGGLGVFEAVLILRLAFAVPEAPLLAVAISYRLITALADLIAAGTAQLDQPRDAP